jgi:hypothetical protein
MLCTFSLGARGEKVDNMLTSLEIWSFIYLCFAYHFYFTKKGLSSLQWLIYQFLTCAIPVCFCPQAGQALTFCL